MAGLVSRRTAIALGACALAAPAVAAEWPSRPVRIIAPSTPGGAADTFGRILAEKLGEMFHERFIVENQAGAGGLLGAAATARAAPDGYTFTTSSIAYHAIAPAVSANPGFDPMKDFTHIAFIGGPPNVFVVSPSLKITTLKELMDRARTETFGYVSPGTGTLGHLLGEYFALKTGIKLQHIPTKGASQAMMDIVSGNVTVGTMTWTSALGQLRAKQVIPIAVSASQRLREFPDLPTFKELGYDDLVATTWFGFSGPAGLDPALTTKLNAAVVKSLAMPDVKERFERDAIETKEMTSAEFTAFMASEIAKWAPIAKRVVQN